jgi:hypothetical protein
MLSFSCNLSIRASYASLKACKILYSNGVSRDSFSPKGKLKGSSETTMRAFARTRKRAREGDDSLSPSPNSSSWEVVVKWDDICLKHIIPRLKKADVKFLHGE